MKETGNNIVIQQMPNIDTAIKASPQIKKGANLLMNMVCDKHIDPSSEERTTIGSIDF